MTEYRFCISSSICGRSRFQNLSRIFQVEEVIVRRENVR